ncbi:MULTISPECIES: P-loop ATPase, Sll1717 family [Thalassospira]|uniref:KAP NTPase domain-containing protein n=2 Tax=Thalassospira TaxID=168934 RepID=A0A367W2V3_9PROT|nr:MULTISPECIES: hypothetical protein [Thalassospira]MDG4721375.1 hypothetical protein [Thalassospira sp. FZY0004]RCK32893.1 hypothetical protein TH19_18480 [Thalassospira profundimaris]
MVSSFKRIKFGANNAEKEESFYPELLVSGYVDIRNIDSLAKGSPEFLVLGYKGSGKSSLAFRHELISREKYDEFSTIINLGNFPYTLINRIVKGDIEPESKLPIAWSIIIGIKILDSLNENESVKNKDGISSILNYLSQSGIPSTATIDQITKKLAKKTFKLSNNNIGGYETSYELNEISEIPSLNDFILKTINETKFDGSHTIFIDGMDDILTKREAQYQSLGMLVYQCEKLNLSFKKNNKNIKIIVLCRTDLFERFHGANKNKIKQGFSYQFDWYVEPGDYENSKLIEAANLRAKISLDREVDVFKEFFPTSLGSGHKSPEEFLLDTTRHTPRDFLTLLNYIQDQTKGDNPTRDEIYDAIRHYSEDYFVPEIKDELFGYASSNQIEELIDALSKLGQREFKLDELLEITRSTGIISDDECIDILYTLYQCSALGNVEIINGKSFFKFKYRNKYSAFERNKKILLHRGLWRALRLAGRELR